jgi:hypothetical protein
VAKAVLVSAVTPLMLKTDANPGGLPLEVFDEFRLGTGFNRAQFYRDVAAGPFYSFNRPGATVSEGIVQNWWRQGMMGGVKAHYEGIKAFSETDFTEDLKAIDVPTLVLHGNDDQVVPIADSAELSVKLLPHATLEVYPGFPHGMCTPGGRDQRRPARLRPVVRAAGRIQLLTRRAMAWVASVTLSAASGRPSATASATQWRRCSSSSPTATLCRALDTAEICVSTSMQ